MLKISILYRTLKDYIVLNLFIVKFLRTNVTFIVDVCVHDI